MAGENKKMQHIDKEQIQLMTKEPSKTLISS